MVIGEMLPKKASLIAKPSFIPPPISSFFQLNMSCGVNPIRHGVNPTNNGGSPTNNGDNPIKFRVNTLKHGIDPANIGVNTTKYGVNPMKRKLIKEAGN